MLLNNNIIRETKSVCPDCFADIEAQVVIEEGKVYLKKECAKHGKFKLLLSLNPDYYKRLNDFYFSLIDESFPQRDYIVHLTNKCDLNCPICLARANLLKTQEYSFENLKQFLKGKQGFKIDLMGAEPTQREDLPDIIRWINKSGNIAALHTNGMKISDLDYLKKLKAAGLNEVHLQFDGFDDAVYKMIRGQPLLQQKLKALANLELLNISTDLVVTVVRAVNEQEMLKVLDFVVAHGFIKEVFFLGCRYLGRAKTMDLCQCIMPDELIDILAQQSGYRISRQNIFLFQKLYFCLLAAFKIRKCFYIHHFLLARDKNSYVPIDQIINLSQLEKALDKFAGIKLKHPFLARIYLLAQLALRFMTARGIKYILNYVSFFIPFIKGFKLAKLSKGSILLGFISACDSYSLDYEIARNCGKGALSVEFGIQDTGAIDNVQRDRLVAGNK